MEHLKEAAETKEIQELADRQINELTQQEAERLADSMIERMKLTSDYYNPLYAEIREDMERETAEDKKEAEENDKDNARDTEKTAEEIFKEFGFDKERFLKSSVEAQEKRKETADEYYEDERKKYGKRDLYSWNEELMSEAGPNCYAYAMQWNRDPITGKKFSMRPFPGMLTEEAEGTGNMDVVKSEVELLAAIAEGGERGKEILMGRIRDDLESAGMEIKEVDSASYRPEEGKWLIAVAANPDRGMEDFHFYRKGEGDYWTHKEGVTEVSRLDKSGERITDPEKCNRGDYRNFYGFYEVGLKKTDD
ncbi:MAG TPA: hypothetical protein H9711_00340 [Candidatus Mediterraneibacter intestinavium]|nr:hypothetical protein [Candidatus Mediterraneibacter intestinavium]